MTTLRTLLVERNLASDADVRAADAHRLVYGGDLGTALLEIGVVTERVLVGLLAEELGLRGGPIGELPAAPLRLLALVSGSLAARHELYPLDEHEGLLEVAVSQPLPPALADNLAFALGLAIEPRIVPSVRVRQAIMRDYGIAADRRMTQLAARLDGRPSPLPPAPPEASSQPRPDEGTMLANLEAVEASAEADRAGGAPDVSAPPPTVHIPMTSVEEIEQQMSGWAEEAFPRTKTLPGFASIGPPVPRIPQLVRLSRAELDPVPSRPPPVDESLDSGWEAPSAESMPPGLLSTQKSTPDPAPLAPSPELPRPPVTGPPPEFVMEAASVTLAHVERQRRVRSSLRSGRALAGWARRAAGQSGAPSKSPAPRARGPLTQAAAETALETARSPLAALEVLFEFARQYFEYAALFVVHGDLAEGMDAFGPGSSRERVCGIGVPLDLPSIFATARDRGSPVLSNLSREGLDRSLADDLGRTAERAVLVVPVVVRGRTVALLYGDHGQDAVEYTSVGEVIGFVSLVSAAVERLVVRRKATRGSGPARMLKGEHSDSASTLPLPVSETEPPDLPLPPLRPRAVALPAPPTFVSRTGPDPSSAPTLVRAAVHPPRAVPSSPVADLAESETAAVVPTPEGPAITVSASADVDGIDEMLTAEDTASSSSISDSETMVISISPRAPPARQTAAPSLPPVLIQADLVDRVIAGGSDGEIALGEILGLGEAAIPAVFSRFPGPITIEAVEVETGQAPAGAAGPVLGIVAAMRRLALPFLAVRSADGDPKVRFWSASLLGELHYRDSALALVPRLFDENRSVRRVSVRGLRGIVDEPEAAAAIREELLRILLASEQGEDRRLLALHFILDFRFRVALPRLARLLDDPAQTIASAVHDALRVLSGDDFGRDPARWIKWWETSGREAHAVGDPSRPAPRRTPKG